MGVGVGLLVALQMVPLRKDDAAKAVNEGREVAGGGVVEQAQIAGRGVQTPNAGIGRRFFIFVQLWIEMGSTVTRAVRGKDDTVIGAIERADVVVALWLVGYLGDHRRFIFAQPCDLVELPGVGFDLILFLRARR